MSKLKKEDKTTAVKQSEKFVVFLDAIGRIVGGLVANENTEVLSIKNPVLVHINPRPDTGQLQLQLLPLFFREFQHEKGDSTVWHFKKATITLSDDIVMAPQFLDQYKQVFQYNPQPAAQPPADVVKLFEDE